MESLRKRYPQSIPCLVHTPDGSRMKLLVPLEANAAFLNTVCRKKLKEKASASEGLFLVHKQTICSGTHRLAKLDIDKPNAVEFHLQRENTFG